MTAPDAPERKSRKARPEAESGSQPPDDAAHGEAPEPRPGQPPARPTSPLFRIAPADPKNVFDFEDVADK